MVLMEAGRRGQAGLSFQGRGFSVSRPALPQPPHHQTAQRWGAQAQAPQTPSIDLLPMTWCVNTGPS